MDNIKKISLGLPVIKLLGPKIRMTPQIKLAQDTTVKDALRDRLQRRPESA